MSAQHVAILGHLGPLARAAAAALELRGHAVARIESPAVPAQQDALRPETILIFPFAPSMRREAIEDSAADLRYLRTCLEWSRQAGATRAVLRSHAIAYGCSMKNPGLLEEGRPSLLPRDSVSRRWLEAEGILFEFPDLAPAALRLTTLLDPAEGDLIARMLAGRLALPLAGYDPQLQLLSLSDAAEALARAVQSRATGIFNIAPAGTVPVKDAMKASVPWRLPIAGALQKPIRSLLWKRNLAAFPGELYDCLKYNWTISPARASEELGFEPKASSSEALRDFLGRSGRGRPERIRSSYDEFGLDPDYLEKFSWWFSFLRKVYWRVEVEGLENIPKTDAALLVANHRGFMPFDGVVHRSLILKAHNRHIRFLVIPSLFKFPFLSDFLIRQGGVVASQANTRKLFARRELVGIFPEGINGAFRMYRGAYKLGEMGRNVFARMAIENGVPIIPAAVIGHVEIFPILKRIPSSLVTRMTGWPFFPITATFPLLPLPLPTKWHIRYLEPIPVNHLRPSDAGNPKVVGELAAHVGQLLQKNIDEMLSRRKHVFFGNIFDRSAVPSNHPPLKASR
ncbi:MAG: 1-acyl-sn-glycerol-3-phosphate acyltransferase [Acidobacteriota bacterium]